jgi:hypothetical protein
VVELSPDLSATLAEIDDLKAQVVSRERSAADAECLRRELTIEASTTLTALRETR